MNVSLRIVRVAEERHMGRIYMSGLFGLITVCGRLQDRHLWHEMLEQAEHLRRRDRGIRYCKYESQADRQLIFGVESQYLDGISRRSGGRSRNRSTRSRKIIQVLVVQDKTRLVAALSGPCLARTRKIE